jgi:hypothetical protein
MAKSLMNTSSFYFGSEEEFEWHKTHHDLEDFRIVWEEK